MSQAPEPPGVLDSPAGQASWLAARLRAEPLPAPLAPDSRAQAQLAASAATHGVQALLHAAWSRGDAGLDIPRGLREAMATAAREQAVLEMLQRVELTRLVEALAAEGLPALLMKGAALAYTVYASPDLRPRADTDVFVAAPDLARARELLAGLGYHAPPAIGGELVSYQQNWLRNDRHGLAHAVDLHWRLSNPQVFARVFAAGELFARAQPLPALAPDALALGNVHALLLACIHRVAHHADGDRLIWLYDIHLLASRMDERTGADTAELARACAVSRVCAESLAVARAAFGTVLVPALADLVTRPNADEPSALFLRAPGPAARLASDLRALPGLAARCSLVREILFPSPAYVRARYGARSAAQLPWLYLRRLLKGISRAARG